MNLPVNPPLLPRLARRFDQIPSGGNWIYEPKWDGFRILVFRDGDEVLIQSRDEKPLNRYSPEVLDPVLKQLPKKCALDGELAIARDGRLDFDALQLRIYPAASRVKILAAETPASFVFSRLVQEPRRCRTRWGHRKTRRSPLPAEQARHAGAPTGNQLPAPSLSLKLSLPKN